MGFDARAFMQEKRAPRTRAVPVPALAAYFQEGEDPSWVVRGLTANELARVNEAESRNRKEGALLEALDTGTRSEIVAELQRQLGRTKETRPDTARRLELLVLGSVEPVCSEELAVRVAQDFPVRFFDLTNAVLELTGQGAEAEKKPGGSGAARTSEPA